MTSKRIVLTSALILLGAARAVAQQAPPACACPCPCPEPPPPPLTGSLAAGLSITSGNTDTSAFNLSFDLTYDPKTRSLFKADAFYLRSTSGGVATTDKGAANLRYEYRVTDRVYAFAQLGYQRDRFKNVVYLFTPMVGGGYYVIKEKDLELTVDGSMGGAFEKDSGYDPNNSGAFSVGQGFRWQVHPVRGVHREGDRPVEDERHVGRLLPFRGRSRGLSRQGLRAEGRVPRRHQEQALAQHPEEDRHGPDRGGRLQVLGSDAAAARAAADS